MEEIWPDFCCKGYKFVAMDVDRSGYGYGICLSSDCPHGDDLQAFQLDWDDDELYEEVY